MRHQSWLRVGGFRRQRWDDSRATPLRRLGHNRRYTLRELTTSKPGVAARRTPPPPSGRGWWMGRTVTRYLRRNVPLIALTGRLGPTWPSPQWLADARMRQWRHPPATF